jgi:glucuronoarabinoxylan endo-1,4-beta-xylanase
MSLRKAFCIAVAIGLTANAQTVINLGGVVSNKTGQPVANAIVTLARQAMKDTTGTDGKYLFAKNTAVKLQALALHTEEMSITNGVLQFTLSNSSPVKVEIFDVQGNLLKKEVVKSAAAGVYRFDIAKNCPATNLLVIKAAIGKREVSFPYVSLSSGKYSPNRSGAYASPIGNGLAQMAAILDTLKVTATGYLTKTVTITSYENQQQNITLDSAGSGVTVQLDQTRQVIDGWGINNNWKELGDNGIAACYDSVNGLGLNILRIGMNENGDVMSGAADISKARSRGAKIIGSTWSPPGNWKSDGTINDGGHLNTNRYSDWADRLANFAKNNNLYSMSLGNEGDFASCGMTEPCNGNYPTTLYTAEEMVAFIKVLGPKMRSAAPNCKIMAPEASEWIHTWSDTSGCCSVPGNKPSSDPLKCGCFTGKTTPCSCAPGKGYSYGKYLYEDKAAWAYVDILGVHQYDTQHSVPWPDYVAVADRRPVWQTEMSGVKWWPDGEPNTTIDNGIAVAGWIHDALTVGEMNAWCFWWYNGGSGTNEGLLLNGQDTKRHYTFGNYTKYVRPGMTRVTITGEIPTNVLLTAFKGSGNKVVVVAINKGSSSATVPISISGGTAPASMTPIVTSANENWASKTAVPVSSGTFTATLAAKTITTFVGQ